MFKTITKNACAEIVEKKSKFIANIYYVETVEEAEELIKLANKKYFDARHNCYAFSVMSENGAVNRFSDDGEPSGTAGGPMLNILTSQNLSNVLIVVTRYFGGILLGTGGLVKAYTGASIAALENAEIVEKALGKEAEFVVNYQDLEKLKYYFKQNSINIVNIEYEENVRVVAEITDEKFQRILQEQQNLNFNILDSKALREKFIKIEK